jgi:hypothetical protein
MDNDYYPIFRRRWYQARYGRPNFMCSYPFLAFVSLALVLIGMGLAYWWR